MATSTRSGQTNVTRKVVLLGLLVSLAVIVYSGAWLFAATMLEKRLAELFDRDNPVGAVVDCRDMDLRGFPFRIGLFCSGIAVDDHYNGLSASFGAVRSAAQVYAPGHIVWEMDGPAEIRSALGVSLSLQWDRLRSSVNAGLDGMSRTSIVAEKLKSSVTTVMTGDTLDADTSHGELHLRRAGADLDAALLIRDTVISKRGGDPLPLPPVSASIDMTLLGKAGYLDFHDGTAKGLYGTSGEIRRLVIDIGEGRVITISGPLSVGDDGNLSGQLHVELERVDAWRGALGTAFPGTSETFDSAAKVLTALFIGKDSGSADLNLTNGVISLGIIPIGVLPPL